MPQHFENAIMENDYCYVVQRLNQFEPVPANSVNEALQTGLMIACQHKSIETVKVFLKMSTTVKNDDPSFCNVNLADASGWTALHYAAQSGSSECIKLLIENKANTNSVNEALQTSLMIACQHKSVETVKVFLKMSTAVKNDDPSLCNVNLETGSGWTALHYAVKSGSWECVKLLIKHKAEIDATTDKNETPLHFAAQNNFYDIVKLLIDNKAEINATTDKNETALFLATKYNHPDIVEFLIENNCLLQRKTWFKKPEKYMQNSWMSQKGEYLTALEVAVQQNFVEIAKCLLFHLIRRYQLNEKELNELLLKAVKNDHTIIAHELLINGANVNNSQGIISNYHIGSIKYFLN